MFVIVLVLGLVCALLIAAAFYLLDRLDTVKGERDDERRKAEAVERHAARVLIRANQAEAKLEAAMSQLRERCETESFWRINGPKLRVIRGGGVN